MLVSELEVVTGYAIVRVGSFSMHHRMSSYSVGFCRGTSVGTHPLDYLSFGLCV
jgi:hypothetical protein